MASEIMATIEKLPREREELESREDVHHADTRDRGTGCERSSTRYRYSETFADIGCPASSYS